MRRLFKRRHVTAGFMFISVLVLGAVACASAQYGAQQPAQDSYPQQQPPQYLPNPIVVPLPIPPYPRSSSSEGKSCGWCKYLKTSCEGVPRRTKCFQATIKNFIDRHGCKAAFLSCGYTREPATLETIDGEILGEGIGFQKLVKCGRSEKWCARDIQDNSVEFRTVRCIVKKTRPPRPLPPNPPPRPMPIAE